MKRLDTPTAVLVEQSLAHMGFHGVARLFTDQTVWLTEDTENALVANALGDFWSVDFNKYVLQDVGINDIELTTDAAAELRREVIRIRDNFRANHYYKESVVMSHVLAWLARVQDHMTLDPHG